MSQDIATYIYRENGEETYPFIKSYKCSINPFMKSHNISNSFIKSYVIPHSTMDYTIQIRIYICPISIDYKMNILRLIKIPSIQLIFYKSMEDDILENNFF